MERIPTPGFSHIDEPAKGRRQVHVPNRDEIGEEVDPGKNMSPSSGMYVVAVHFPSTGEVIYYDKSRVTYLS